MPELLSNKTLGRKISTVVENGPADGVLISHKDGRMYVSSPQDNAVKARNLSGKRRTLTTVVQNPQLRWPDTFSEGPDGRIYVTTSHIQDSADYKPTALVSLPTLLWSIKPNQGGVTGSTGLTRLVEGAPPRSEFSYGS